MIVRRAGREAGISFFNEMFDGKKVRPAYAGLIDWVEKTSPEVLAQKKQEAEALFRRIGITFAVYGEGGNTERLIPFDMMPRVFTEAEWRKLERGREAAGAGAERASSTTSTTAPRSCAPG